MYDDTQTLSEGVRLAKMYGAEHVAFCFGSAGVLRGSRKVTEDVDLLLVVDRMPEKTEVKSHGVFGNQVIPNTDVFLVQSTVELANNFIRLGEREGIQIWVQVVESELAIRKGWNRDKDIIAIMEIIQWLSEEFLPMPDSDKIQ